MAISDEEYRRASRGRCQNRMAIESDLQVLRKSLHSGRKKKDYISSLSPSFCF